MTEKPNSTDSFARETEGETASGEIVSTDFDGKEMRVMETFEFSLEQIGEEDTNTGEKELDMQIATSILQCDKGVNDNTLPEDTGSHTKVWGDPHMDETTPPDTGFDLVI